MSVFISQQLKLPPSTDTYKIGVPVYGATLQGFGDRTNFLAYGKARRIANITFNSNHHQTWTENTTAFTEDDQGLINKSHIHNELPISDNRDILFTCSPTARFICLQIYYDMDNRDTYRPLAYLKAKVIKNVLTTRDVIDAGFEATYLNGFLDGEIRDDSTSHYFSFPKKLSTGSNFIVPTTGSYSTITPPRPLFIPVADRNTQIAINLDMKYVRIRSVALIEPEEGFAI